MLELISISSLFFVACDWNNWLTDIKNDIYCCIHKRFRNGFEIFAKDIFNYELRME